MSQPIFRLANPEIQVPLGLPMLATVSGFADAGGSISQVNSNIFANFDAQLVIEFNNDELLDYRSRRPSVYFQKDHIEFLEPPVLGVYLVRDDIGQPFLYLDGYEPDFKWNSFTAAMLEIMDLFSVSEFVWVHSVPFPLPHTRPLGITVSGNRADLVERFSEWRPETQIPGTAIHFLEHTLREGDFLTTGFVFLVPHYLADSEYPQVAIKAFEVISAATGLIFPTDELREENVAFLARLDARVAENQDLAKLVANLENGYQSGSVGGLGANVKSNLGTIPNAEEIAQELEAFLTKQNRNEEED